jgi:hypothetical protein
MRGNARSAILTFLPEVLGVWRNLRQGYISQMRDCLAMAEVLRDGAGDCSEASPDLLT